MKDRLNYHLHPVMDISESIKHVKKLNPICMPVKDQVIHLRMLILENVGPLIEIVNPHGAW